MLGISVLGPVVAHREGQPVPIRGRSQRILLARLATTRGRPAAPERLIEDLWESQPPADATHALQAHVSRLRSALPIGVQHVDGGYRLSQDEIDVDAERFERLAGRGRARLDAGELDAAGVDLRAALGLWRGPAFAGLAEVPGLRPVAVRLEELRATTVADRIDVDLARGEHGAVVGELEQLVAEDPLRERTWCQLLVALVRDGRQGDALGAFRRARAAFRERLGIEPGEQLAELHQAVLAGRVPAPAVRALPRPPAAERATGPPVEVTRRVGTPFAGRARELAVLDRQWARLDQGPALVAITGEPGIGKTRLASEFAARCAERGGRVLFGRCDESWSVPHQPFVEIIRSDVGGVPAADLPEALGPSAAHLTDLLPELAHPGTGTTPSTDPDVERYRLFDAVAGWLADRSALAPMLLIVDDLQWADQPTLALLRHLVRSPRAARVLVVATYRDRAHPADDPRTVLISDLLGAGEQVSSLALSGLGPEPIAELLTAELEAAGVDDTPTAELAQQVETAAGGNPLFVKELARHLADPIAGPAPGLGAGLPASVRGVVSQRLRRLPAPVRTLLSTAAVVGRAFDPRLVQAVEGLADAELDELLTAAAYLRLIEKTSQPRLRYVFTHDLVRAGLHDAIPPVRRAQLHRQVAETLEQWYVADLAAHYDELAHHFSAAAEVGPTTEAVRYLCLAGDAAMAHRAPSLAAEHFTVALELGAGEDDPAQRCDLLIRLARAQRDSGQAAHRETFLAAAALAEEIGDGALLATAAVANSRGWWSSTVEVDEPRVAMVEAALGSNGAADPRVRVALLSSWALESVRDPARRRESVSRSEEALTLARETGDDLLLAETLADHYAITYASFTDPHGCVAISAELVELARSTGDPALELMASVGHAQASLLLGDLETSDRFLAVADRMAAELNHRARLWMVRTWGAARLLMRGRLAEAEAAAVAAFELGNANEQPDALTWFAGQLFTLRWQQGRLAELMELIEEQVSAESDAIPAWHAAYALALAEVGRHEEATAILEEFVADLGRLPRDMLWLQGMAYLCTTCATVRHAAAAEVLHRALTPYAGLLADNGTLHAGPVDFHLGTMAEVAGSPERAARHLEDAELLCRRIGAPLWLDRVQAARARLDGRSAPAATTQARAVAGAGPGPVGQAGQL